MCKRRPFHAQNQNAETGGLYRAASCARLSVDDESYGTSGSVLNQHAMIRDFADANGGLSIVAEYSDDGLSGSTFESRPGWGGLLADVGPARSTASWSRT